MDDFIQVSLENISGGGAVERFNYALAEVIENIMDPNTKIDAIREVKLTLKIKPCIKDANGKVNYSLQVQTKLAPLNSIDNVMYLGRQGGELTAYEQNIIEQSLPFNQSKITDIKEVQNDE